MFAVTVSQGLNRVLGLGLLVLRLKSDLVLGV